VAALTTAQVAQGLTTTQVAALTTAQIVALGTAQVQALTTAQINQGLTTQQVAAIQTTDLVALKTSQIVAITTAQIRALGTQQVASLTTTQVRALTSTQMAAFTTAQITHLNLSTPLALDLNGDGLRTVDIEQGVRFDLLANGEQQQTGWVAPEDGLLVIDRNADGQINNGSELFGSSTTLADGSKAGHGYQALADLDVNHDGVVNQADAGFADLKVWVDANTDGVSQAGELRSLTDLGITSLDVQAESTSIKDNGNWIGLVSSYQTQDGQQHQMGDVWFVTDQSAPQADLRSRVNGLVEVMQAFGQEEAAPAAPSLPNPNPGSSTLSGQLASTLDLMRQFDANGQPNASASGLAATSLVGQSLLPKPDAGFLVPDK
jgi:trimeric autotransporter adhesin